ncbi:PDR/VanB family oxidoreductase [Cupriavidus respiraculi]|uniref:PDR/VanB family oxidoreductase n=1 Tax=Cupriavidus respiraculi TaxID=195930 RepID=UPI001C952402|nr:PDR/VanB family oxidoreductase [Cupriavidus respiraculi]MBY4949582.1 PDR/VanB family oxidoreductase [Cupriavidus respiraculi]
MSAPMPAGWREMRVRGIRLETDTIRSFELTPIAPEPLAPWTPGAHLDIALPDGGMRQYSLCGDPAEAAYRIAVKREPASRGGSAWLHDAVTPGMVLRVGTPRNAFGFDPQATQLVLMGAGIGITPLLPMWRAARRAGIPVALHLAAGARDEVPFREALEDADDVGLYLDRAPAAIAQALAQAMPAWAAGALLYTCGPAGFMEHVLRCAGQRGWPDHALRMERFAPIAPAPGGDRAAAAGPSQVPVRFARSGITVQARPGESLLALARRHGIDIGTGCEQGLCGACMTEVAEGVPEHRDSYLSESERERWVLPCVSGCGALPLALVA